MKTLLIALVAVALLWAGYVLAGAAPKPPAMPAEPTADKVRPVDPCSEIVAWRTRTTTAPAMTPWTGRKPVSWWTRRTTTSGTWTVELRRPDGTREIVQTMDLKIPAGWHVDISIRTAAPLAKDPNKEAVK